jgi:hypothetical protein
VAPIDLGQGIGGTTGDPDQKPDIAARGRVPLDPARAGGGVEAGVFEGINHREVTPLWSD